MEWKSDGLEEVMVDLVTIYCTTNMETKFSHTLLISSFENYLLLQKPAAIMASKFLVFPSHGPRAWDTNRRGKKTRTGTYFVI